MIRNKLAEVDFLVDNYVDIIDFDHIKLDTGNDQFYFAALIGCIEGIIQINKNKEYITFLNMYKIKLSSKYKFMSLYNFIKNNNKYYKYIVNYFNIWHGNNEVFNYDEYNKKDLMRCFYELASLLIEERNLAEICGDKSVLEAYNFFCNNISSVLSIKINC